MQSLTPGGWIRYTHLGRRKKLTACQAGVCVFVCCCFTRTPHTHTHVRQHGEERWKQTSQRDTIISNAHAFPCLLSDPNQDSGAMLIVLHCWNKNPPLFFHPVRQTIDDCVPPFFSISAVVYYLDVIFWTCDPFPLSRLLVRETPSERSLTPLNARPLGQKCQWHGESNKTNKIDAGHQSKSEDWNLRRKSMHIIARKKKKKKNALSYRSDSRETLWNMWLLSLQIL